MGGQYGSIIYILALFAILYFLMIRPQQQRAKKHQEMVRNLKVNDQIITAGGIIGTIVKLKEETVILRVADGVRIELLKTAVGQLRESAPEEEETEAAEEKK